MPYIPIFTGNVNDNPDISKVLEVLSLIPENTVSNPEIQVIAVGPFDETTTKIRTTTLDNILEMFHNASPTEDSKDSTATLNTNIVAKAKMMLEDNVPAEKVCAYLDVTMTDLENAKLIEKPVTTDTYYVPVRCEVLQYIPVKATSSLDALQTIVRNKDYVRNCVHNHINADSVLKPVSGIGIPKRTDNIPHGETCELSAGVLPDITLISKMVPQTNE